MSDQEAQEQARSLAAQARADGDPTAWFERLYAAAVDGQAQVPWDRGEPHPLLVEWASARQASTLPASTRQASAQPAGAAGVQSAGGQPASSPSPRALVVGCGLGYDAEFVAGLGYATTAFDISASAVRAAQARVPGSLVHYQVADLLQPPASWQDGFDLVLESMTVQSLPPPLRGEAIARIRPLVGPGGTLLVIAIAVTEPIPAADGPPWPLVRAEVDAFAAGDLRPVRVDEVREEGVPRRWRAEFRRS